MTQSKTSHKPAEADAATGPRGDEAVETHKAHRPAGRHAAHRATQQGALAVTLPGFGRINLGTAEQLAYVAGITALAASSSLSGPSRWSSPPGMCLLSNVATRPCTPSVKLLRRPDGSMEGMITSGGLPSLSGNWTDHPPQ